MVKRGFTIIEICVVIFIILGAAFVFLPKGIESTKQAKLISHWVQQYSELEYMFSVIKSEFDAEGDYSPIKFQEKIESNLRLLKPVDRVYKQYLRNGIEINPVSLYNPEMFYETNNNEIVGFKWVKKDCKGHELCAVLTFDVNGYSEPNVFGIDIFGVNVKSDKITALGEGIESKELKKDCENSGIYCSYYYLIGGRFE